jgi:hypothetical protein
MGRSVKIKVGKEWRLLVLRGCWSVVLEISAMDRKYYIVFRDHYSK